jgi:hypothetical protein
MPVNLCIFYTTWLSQLEGYNRSVAEKVQLPCSDRQSAFSHKSSTTATLCAPVRSSSSSTCHGVGPLVDPSLNMPVQKLKVAILPLTLLRARNPFRENFNYWHVSRKEAGQIYVRYKCQIPILQERETFAAALLTRIMS